MFSPVKPGYFGGMLKCTKDKIKYNNVTGTSGYRWLESSDLRTGKDTGRMECIDITYYDNLVKEAEEDLRNLIAKGTDEENQQYENQFSSLDEFKEWE